jgi:hypothetical protein
MSCTGGEAGHCSCRCPSPPRENFFSPRQQESLQAQRCGEPPSRTICARCDRPEQRAASRHCCGCCWLAKLRDVVTTLRHSLFCAKCDVPSAACCMCHASPWAHAPPPLDGCTAVLHASAGRLHTAGVPTVMLPAVSMPHLCRPGRPSCNHATQVRYCAQPLARCARGTMHACKPMAAHPRVLVLRGRQVASPCRPPPRNALHAPARCSYLRLRASVG